MEKTITIDGKPITFKATASLGYRYKQQFGVEYLAELQKLQDFTDSKTQKKIKTVDGKTVVIDDYDYSKLSLEFLYNLLWAMAKTADPSIPDPVAWLDSFNVFPVVDIWKQLQDVVIGNLASKN